MKKRVFSYSCTRNSNSWYAYIDAGSNCAYHNNTTVKVNLGKKEFVNKMPNRFFLFIYGYHDLKNGISCAKVEDRTHLLCYT